MVGLHFASFFFLLYEMWIQTLKVTTAEVQFRTLQDYHATVYLRYYGILLVHCRKEIPLPGHHQFTVNNFLESP
jgi:hypothetical protein